MCLHSAGWYTKVNAFHTDGKFQLMKQVGFLRFFMESIHIFDSNTELNKSQCL